MSEVQILTRGELSAMSNYAVAQHIDDLQNKIIELQMALGDATKQAEAAKMRYYDMESKREVMVAQNSKLIDLLTKIW